MAEAEVAWTEVLKDEGGGMGGGDKDRCGWSRYQTVDNVAAETVCQVVQESFPFERCTVPFLYT